MDPVLTDKRTFDASVGDPQFRSSLLRGVLSGQAEAILKSSYRCDPPNGPEEVRTQFFTEKGLVLWSVPLQPPDRLFGHGPQIACSSDCQQLVLFASGELAMLRTRRYDGYNNVYTYGVGEYIEQTTVDITPLTETEFDNLRTRISEDLWRRVCEIAGGGIGGRMGLG
jgi:hypothetical protein